MPLMQRLIPSAQLPVSAPELLEQLLPEIAATVGSRLINKSSIHPLLRRDLPSLTTLLQTKQPLHHLDEVLKTQNTASPLSMSTISVAICTRDRAESLERCLRSLQKMSVTPHEIILVDNAPRTDATRRVVEKMQDELPNLRYVLEPRPGLDVARNAAVQAATGEILAYTDDDVEVHPEWLMGIRRGFAHPKVMAVTGLALPAELETASQWIFETRWGFGRGYRPLTFNQRFFRPYRSSAVPVWDVGAGANMAFRREIFARVGGFDERLDAGAAGCSGDSEFWYRVMAEGWWCQYEPSAVVSHYHRRDEAGLEHQLHYYMKGHVAALLVQHQKYGHRSNLRNAFIHLPIYYAKLFAIRTRQGPTSWVGGLKGQVTGCLAGMKFFWDHRDVPESLHPFRTPDASSSSEIVIEETAPLS
jgi:glycosyltransferase involved in cell wall biosynthesis